MEITESLGLGGMEASRVAGHLQLLQHGNNATHPPSLNMTTTVRRVVLAGILENVEKCKSLVSDCVKKVLRLAAQHHAAPPAAAGNAANTPQQPAVFIQQPPQTFGGAVAGGPGGPYLSQTPAMTAVAGPAGVPHQTQGLPWTSGATTGTGAPASSSTAPAPHRRQHAWGPGRSLPLHGPS
uniref:Uncharacterized protein n=1 Tax=Chromera velia CCMP2878 TaxID=1169474 RepID=A0A0G4HLF2_9ALVE|eukprot:Cvel_28728.t1-p1 / transcript=Cvel_28728.t1 / gene=Cvel_28728 / organism=Chromera_velia_CCMP2878 / gene_product=hypothetical protein / transcript_product=hypothetical protein / location=Cvel_scaffold3815:302-1282(+) / protein_length=180 / sequence_SO=supercontig / SO=protein_coding / is_pseudo=false